MFKMNAGYFLIQLASEKDKERVYKLIGEHSREDANGVAQVCFIGVINPQNPRVETPEEVCDDLVLASKYIPKERLGSTDDCGFSPFSIDVKPKHGSPDVARDIAFQKITARVEGTKHRGGEARALTRGAQWLGEMEVGARSPRSIPRFEFRQYCPHLRLEWGQVIVDCAPERLRIDTEILVHQNVSQTDDLLPGHGPAFEKARGRGVPRLRPAGPSDGRSKPGSAHPVRTLRGPPSCTYRIWLIASRMSRRRSASLLTKA